VVIAPQAWIDCEYPYLISIGSNCTLSKGVKLIAHDASTFPYLGVTRVGKIEIKDNCYLGENVIVLPGVTIGPNVMIAAGSVVNKDIAPDSCVAGVPARFYANFGEFLERNRANAASREMFDYTKICLEEDAKEIESLKNAAQESDVYVKGFIGIFPWSWNGE